MAITATLSCYINFSTRDIRGFYLPSDYLDVTNSEKYASAFLSNKYFARATTSYAAQDALFLPLLHTWSLAIEWQWYLFLPFALYFLHKINVKESINHFYFVVLVTIISFVLVFYYQKINPKIITILVRGSLSLCWELVLPTSQQR